jgi:3-oxoacyl-[acyl-carrier-protein] synthase II
MRIVVTGIGFRSALGDLPQTWQCLLDGRTAIAIAQPFADLPPLPLAMIHLPCGAICVGKTSPQREQRDLAKDLQPQQMLALTQLVVAEAIRDAKLTLPLPDCGVVIGSSRGCQAQWEKFTSSSPPDLTNWLTTLPHSPAIATARYISSRSVLLAPMAACATGIWSIAQAVSSIRSGACQMAIAGAVETPITPLSIAGFSQMGALATTGCYPFDKRRDGLVLGEAGAVLILETATAAIDRGAKIYGEILGVGLTNDAYHICATDLDLGAASQAILQCLARSNLNQTEIDYIHAHGTGTQLNDLRESLLIQEVFPQGVPVSSTKGATGHTLGASGAIGIALCLQSIATQILPPCVGLNNSEFDLDLVTKPRDGVVDRSLCLSFGFGGQNAAIALQRWH